jgi:SRSO17 transposase
VGKKASAPGPQEKRFAAYREGLAKAAGHADRETPLKNYCAGLLLPGERKSVEPMAARLAPDNIQRMHHLVADAPWSDEEMLRQVRSSVLPAMREQGKIVCWIVDDTGFPKKGSHSVGVARQYCGQVGKQDNCRVAVSLSVATWSASLPIAFRLYLPESWTEDKQRRKEGGIPEEIQFQTKPQIALAQIGKAVEEEVTGRGCGRCRLWSGGTVSGRPYGTGAGVCGGCAVFVNGVGARDGTAAAFATQTDGTATEFAAAGQRPPACFGEATSV